MGFTNRFEYNGFRQVAKSIDASGRTNSYQYCDCGSLNSMTDALGNTTSYSYDNLGRRTRTTFPGGSYQDSVYDIANRVIRTADNSGISVTNYYTVNGLLCVSSNAAGQIVRKTYDDHDRMSEAVDRNGVWTAFRYDELNRPIDRVISRTVTIDGPDTYTHEMTEHFDYTNYVRGAVGTYRALLQFAEWSGVPVWTNSLPVGPSTSFGYDLFDRKTNEIHWDTNGVAMMTNRFAYNAAGDLVTLIDGKSQTTIWKYDLHGRVTNKVDTTSAELFRYAYDANGRLTSRWSAEKGTTAYSYDAVGNVTSVNYPVSSDITLGYDALNRLTNMVDAVGTTRYDYTSFGALQSEDGPWADDTVSYSYSANRLRSGYSLAQPNASPWTLAYGYDAAARLSSVTSPAGTFGYEYKVGQSVSPASLIQKLTLPNGSAITNQFDERARWLGTTLRSSTGTLLNQHLYSYNDLDQRTQQTRTGNDFVAYGYDDLGQLTSAKGKEFGGTTNRLNEQFGYAYDAAGNLNFRTNDALVQTFNVNSLNALTTVTRTTNQTVAGDTFGPATSVTVNGATATRYADNTFAKVNIALVNGSNTFTAIAQDSLGRLDTNIVSVYLPATNTFLYDLNGNLRTNGTRTFEYDDENQLTRITEPSAWKAEFTYDGKLRRRIEKNYRWTGAAWLQTNEVRFVYDGNLVIQDRSEFNLPTLTLTRGLDLSGGLQGAGGIGGLLALSDHRSPVPDHLYFHSDGNGNVTALVDANESIAARYLYDPFGNTLSAAGPKAGANRYRFSSKPVHELSGMYDYLYRFYMPELQRWPNRDPIGELGEFNLYGFIRNEPLTTVDLFGLAGPPVRTSPGGGGRGGGTYGWPPRPPKPIDPTGRMGDASDVANYEPGHLHFPHPDHSHPPAKLQCPSWNPPPQPPPPPPPPCSNVNNNDFSGLQFCSPPPPFPNPTVPPYPYPPLFIR
jgi:RHS repeat-associated protein